MADGILNPIEQLEADFDFDVYTKQEVDALLDEKADKSDTYTKTETDALLDDKADADAVYTKTETDTLFSAKADKSTTLAGYGITDAYTKTQTDTLLNGKADADSVYTKTEIDTKIPNSVGSATKPVYVNGGVVSACTYELNKTVPANAVFTDTTYTAGNGLNLNGTSFSTKAGTNVTVDGNGINVNGNGVVASADSGLISGGTAYTELRPTLDGTWVKNAQTTATNLQKLEGGIEYLYGLLSHQYDQLKKYINGNYYDYDTDTDAKYTKTVPQGAMPYASLDSIGGKTLVWNQILRNGNFADASGWTAVNCSLSVADNVATITFDGSNATVYIASGTVTESFNLSHKYYICGDFLVSGSASARVFMYGISTTTDSVNFPATESSNFVHQARISNGNSGTDYRFRIQIATNSVAGTVQVKNAFICDLTLMYGAGNEPSTVQDFTAQFPAQYYPYNAGTLLSAGVTEVVSNTKNKLNMKLFADAYPSYCSWNATTQTLSVNTWATVLFNTGIGVDFPAGYTIQCIITDGTSSGARLGILYEDNTRAILTASTPSITFAKRVVRLYLDTSSVGTMFFKNCQVESGTTATSYSPYGTIATYPIPAEIRSLEGYGWSAGTVFNYVDFERKVFVQRVSRIDMGDVSLGWTQHGTYTDVFYNNYMIADKGAGANLICPKYTINGTFANYANITNVGIYVSSATAGRIAVKDPTYADATAFVNGVSGVYLYYELDTPIETDISAYLTDDNLIEVESGGTLTFPNQHGDDYRIPIPSSETFMVDLQEAI